MLDLHTGPSLRRARLCRGVCARELRSLRLAGLNLRNLGLRARLHYTRLGCLGVRSSGQNCRGAEHQGDEGGGEVSFQHGLYDNASHYAYQADVSADLHFPGRGPKTVFRAKQAKSTLRFITSPLNTVMRSYTPQHSDPNRQNRHPKQAVHLTHPQTAHASGQHSDLSRQKQLQNQTLSLTDADVATTSYTIQTQTGEKHPQIHYFPSEYSHAQLHATAFRHKQAKPTPKTGSSPHGRRWAR